MVDTYANSNENQAKDVEGTSPEINCILGILYMVNNKPQTNIPLYSFISVGGSINMGVLVNVKMFCFVT